MNKKKLLLILEFVIGITILKIIYDNVFMPVILKLDNSFTVLAQGNIGNLVSWLIMVTITATAYEAIIKPLIKKLLRKN